MSNGRERSTRSPPESATHSRFSDLASVPSMESAWQEARLTRRIVAATARSRSWPRWARVGAALVLIALAAVIRVAARDALTVAPNIPVLIALVIAAVGLGRSGAVTVSVAWILLLSMQAFASDGGPPLRVSDALVLMASLTVTIGIGWLIATLAWALDSVEQRDALLQESRDRLVGVLDALPIGVVVCEAPSGRVVLANDAVEVILRHPVFPTPDVAGFREWEAYHPDGRRVEGPDYPLGRVLATGESAEGEFRYKRGDGTRAWVRITGAPVRDAKGRLVAGVVAVVDIDELRRLTEHQALLVAELSHRVKNSLAVVHGLATQTLVRARSLEEFREAFDGRLQALSTAHTLLLRTNWKGTTLAELIEAVLKPFLSERLSILGGPVVDLDARRGVALALTLHEFATNAAKYGALATPTGRLEVAWEWSDQFGPDGLRIRWSENGLAQAPQMGRGGFGTKLIRRSVEGDLDGHVTHTVEGNGMLWTLEIPMPQRQTP